MILTSRFRRTAVTTVIVSAVAFAIVALSISPAPAAPAGNCTYYSNGSYSTVVGQYGKDCCNNTVAWGVKTKFSICGGCFICYPPPR